MAGPCLTSKEAARISASAPSGLAAERKIHGEVTGAPLEVSLRKMLSPGIGVLDNPKITIFGCADAP